MQAKQEQHETIIKLVVTMYFSNVFVFLSNVFQSISNLYYKQCISRLRMFSEFCEFGESFYQNKI